MIGVLDRVKSEASHAYTWQANIGSEKPDGTNEPSDFASSDGAGMPGFLLRGRNRGYVRGWVLHPTDAVVTAGDPLRITTSGTNVDIWIVLYIGSGSPPEASRAGSGLATELRIGPRWVFFEGERMRVITSWRRIR